MKIYTHEDYNKQINELCQSRIDNKLKRKDFSDHYQYILSSIYLKHQMDKRYKKSDFVPLNTFIARKLISEREFKTIMSDLVNLNILESDYIYIKGEKSLGYRFLEYKYGWKHVDFKDTKLKEKLEKAYKENEVNVSKRGDGYKTVNYWNKELEINEQKALEYLNNKTYNDTKEWFSKFLTNTNNEFYNEIKNVFETKDNINNIENILTGLFNFFNDKKIFIDEDIDNAKKSAFAIAKQPIIIIPKKSILSNLIKYLDFHTSAKCCIGMVNHEKFCIVDNKGHRLHSNLTNMSRHFRQFLSVSGDSLYQVDISNSQPTFLGLLMLKNENIDKVELGNYLKECQEGNFYEYLAKKGGFKGDLNNKDTRKEFKQKVFSGCLFDRNRQMLSKWEKIFKKAFPTIFNAIRLLKKDNYNVLAIMLQLEESDFIFKTVSKINKACKFDAPLLTIHDSIISNKFYINKVKEIMAKCFKEKYNFVPKLEITNL